MLASAPEAPKGGQNTSLLYTMPYVQPGGLADPRYTQPRIQPTPVAPVFSATDSLVGRANQGGVNPAGTSGEDSFKQTYLNSLKPNTDFTFNAQNPAIFGGMGKGVK